MTARIFRRDDGVTLALLRESDFFDVPVVDLVAPPRRFWADRPPPALLEQNLEPARLEELPGPTALLAALPPGDNWPAQGRRSIERLKAWFLVCEDPERRLDRRPVATLAHQASIVRHILANPRLDRVLIADEVGLGKTVEAGLLISELSKPGLRVLYLAPARLVRNVRAELERLGLSPRCWVAGDDRDANLSDPLIVASIHRAALRGNSEAFLRAPPWDVIIVDECHHLSDWQRGGGRPTLGYRLVRDLVERQQTTSRLILMSGTPHQGHHERFENLLKLLRRDGEPEQSLAGRVIYRTKEDVLDWEQRPLFPGRKLNDPLILDLGAEHRRWLERIHDLYATPSRSDVRGARQRAAGWRSAQALQWATSSVQAGLGFLVRQALRAGWGLDRPSLRDAVASLRPYRLGRSDEPVESVFERLGREVAQQMAIRDVEDIEEAEEAEEPWRPDPIILDELLRRGVGLLHTSGDEKWRFVYERLLRSIGSEKVVLFAQPIETVTSFARFLGHMTGRPPALIVGNQSENEREAQVRAFWREDGPQFLISSRAGGEGLNLQVSRRLVHLDVPWNPMELEQRVGRVHRFGSRRTIIVDTVLSRDSRETDAYRVARAKLQEIARALAPEKFEAVFSRVMSLVPPAELQSILGERPLSPLTADETTRLSALVTAGFESWRQFHDRFRDQEQEIRALDPGQAGWADLAAFAHAHLDAVPVDGFEALRFQWRDGEIQDASVSAEALRMPDGEILACGDYAGMPVTGAKGERVELLGLNLARVSDALRRLAFPELPAGAAHLRWPSGRAIPGVVGGGSFAVWIAARQSIRLPSAEGTAEIASSLHAWVVRSDGSIAEADGASRGALVRGLLASGYRREPTQRTSLIESLVRLEPQWTLELRRPTAEEREQRIAHAVTPLLAAVVEI